ncbi:TPA: hypothetical protein ACY4P7_004686, partial [Vibrio parahaemolyticus]
GKDKLLFSVHGSGNRFVAVGNAIVYSSDGGQTWSTAATDVLLQSVHGDGSHYVAVGSDPRYGTYGFLEYSNDGGQSWLTAENVTDEPLLSVHGDGNNFVSVGEHGLIVLHAEQGKRAPSLNKLVVNEDLSALNILFEFDDPDFLCTEKCTMQLWARNENEHNRKRAFESINSNIVLNRNNSTLNGKITLYPDRFNVKPNEKFYLKFQLKGEGFSNTYPRDETNPIYITYQFNYIPYLIAAFLTAIVVTLLLVYWFRPLWLLRLYHRIGLFEWANKVKAPGFSDVIQLLSNLILFLPYLVKKPRVLDAWVKLHKQSFTKNFEGEEVVKSLRYYPLPLRRVVTNERLKCPTPNDFQSDCSAKRTLIQIIGAGGSGKSSFAAQFAKWSLNQELLSHTTIPIWLDQDIDNLSDLLIQHVRRVTGDDSLPELFIKALYERKRLLVVFDRLSEKKIETQEAVKHIPGYLRYLLITSRTEQKFSLSEMTTLETVPLKSENLMGFVNDILQENLEEGSALTGFKIQLDLAQSLANAMTLRGKELPVTPLLVNLFVTKAIENAMTTESALTHLPQNIPEVYFEHLRSVNPESADAKNYLPQEAMIEITKLAARITLGDDFVPKRVNIIELREKLSKARIAMIEAGTDPIARLLDNQVLEQRLVGGSTQVGFTLDPVAEYVAAFSYGEECGSDPVRWNNLIHEVLQQGVNASGFFEALKVTHGVFKDELNWSSVVDWQDETAKNSILD